MTVRSVVPFAFEVSGMMLTTAPNVWFGLRASVPIQTVASAGSDLKSQNKKRTNEC